MSKSWEALKGHAVENNHGSANLVDSRSHEPQYRALPDPVRAQYGRFEWQAHIDVLGHYTRDPNAHCRAFDLDLHCPEDGRLHCLEAFGRQLLCSLHGLHPQAVPAFAKRETARAA